MKKFAKMIPAFVLAAAVGMTTIGCGDDTTSTSNGGDMAVTVTTGADMTNTGPVAHDMATKHD